MIIAGIPNGLLCVVGVGALAMLVAAFWIFSGAASGSHVSAEQTDTPPAPGYETMYPPGYDQMMHQIVSDRKTRKAAQREYKEVQRGGNRGRPQIIEGEIIE